MKHSQRLAKIKRDPRPRGYRKITVDNKIFWWKAMSSGSGINILDSNRKQFYSDFWGGEGTITPKYVSECILKKLHANPK